MVKEINMEKHVARKPEECTHKLGEVFPENFNRG